MFHRKHLTRTADKENTMTETFNRYSIPGMGQRVDYGNGWLDFQFYPEQIAEKVEAFRTEDKAKLIELGGNQSGESFTRPAHPIEKQLLGHIGFRKLPRDLHTTVTAPTRRTRHEQHVDPHHRRHLQLVRSRKHRSARSTAPPTGGPERPLPHRTTSRRIGIQGPSRRSIRSDEGTR